MGTAPAGSTETIWAGMDGGIKQGWVGATNLRRGTRLVLMPFGKMAVPLQMSDPAWENGG